MKSKRAKEKIKSNVFKARLGGGEFADVVLDITAQSAVELAEADARERAVRAHSAVCPHRKGSKCHAFIVGYPTLDDRLHERCEDVVGKAVCKLRMDDFLNAYDNE